MFVPFVFSLDTSLKSYENFFFWPLFYMYANACIRNNWPLISHKRYFERLSRVEDTVFGISMQGLFADFGLNSFPSTEDMLVLNAYPINPQIEDELIAKYASQFDCWIDLLKNDNQEFEVIIGGLLDEICRDFGEKPEGVLIYEYLPKALLSAAQKRGIPVIFQVGGVVRPPFAPSLNALCLLNNNTPELIKLKYERFISENTGVPMLSHKGLLRLFVSEQYIMDIHNIDSEPEYDVGVLHTSTQSALYYVGPEYVSDLEMNAKAKERHNKVLSRARPGFEVTADALDKSPTCFHFCCKCERVLGFATKGMFEAMLAGRIAHEYGSFIFHSFCNNGIEDESKGPAPIEFLNYVLFGLCTPFAWLTDPNYLHFLLSEPSEKELYQRSFAYYTRGISQEDIELYYMSDDRAYRLGYPLFFTDGHKPHEYALFYCTSEIYAEAGLCVWSVGEHTSFEIDLVEFVNEPLTIFLFLHDAEMDWESTNPTQTVICEVNGIVCGSTTFTTGKKCLKYTIPADCFTDKLHITFKYDHLRSIGDIRIAVAFERMYISRPGQRLIEDSMSDEIEALINTSSILDAQVIEMKAYNSGLEAQVAEMKVHNSFLEAQVVEMKASNTGLETQVAETIAYSSGLEAQVAEMKVHNSFLEAQVAELETLKTASEAHVAELQAQIESIHHSRSWKLGNGMMKAASKIFPRKG